MPTQDEVTKILEKIPDPEIGVSIVDLGLIYGIDIDDKKETVTVKMTLTTIGCPLFEHIAVPVKEAVKELPGVKNVVVDLTFDPPWSVEKMSENAKMQLGFT
jgi:metal-sulfur cluster biosynthetic enzyme